MKQILQQSSKKQTDFKNIFNSVSKKMSKPYEVYTINQEKENVIVTQTGSVIHIPQRAFEYANGSLLTGNIDIYYREIRTAADIIANGIDMRVKTAAGKYVLQTSGMFEMLGFQNNKKINIKKSKKLTVEFVSNSTKEFDNYYYNEKTKNWEKSDKNQQNLLIPFIQPIKKEKNDFIVNVKLDISNLNQLNKYNNIKWKFIGNSPKNEIQKKLNSINFHNQSVKVINEKLMILELNLSSKTSKEVLNLQIQPVFEEKDFEQAKEIFETQNKLIKEVEQKRKQLLNSKNILNTFSVNKFSYQNCDIVYRFPNHTFTNANFKVAEEIISENLEVYLVSGEDNIVMKFEKDFTKFNFNPKLKNKIIAIIPGKMLAVMPSSDFSKIQIKNNTTFELKRISDNIDNLENFNSLIKNL